MKGAIVSLVLVLVTACGIPNITRQAGPIHYHCADVLLNALTSPNKTVPESITCLSPSYQAFAASNGIKKESDWEGFANWWGYGNPVLIGSSPEGANVYELTGPNGIVLEVVWLDSSGLVLDATQAKKP